MRAIDADSLNNYKFGENLMASSYADGWDDAIDAIMKDAPTIEDANAIQYSKGYQDGFLEAKSLYERPEGKWQGNNCPFCKATSHIQSKFCSECGAKLKKEEST